MIARNHVRSCSLPRGAALGVGLLLMVAPSAAQTLSGRTAQGRVVDGGGPVSGSQMVRVNRSSAGIQANGTTDVSAVSADGRVVAYSSVATNLVPGDPAGLRDVFVTDVATGQTRLVSVSLTGFAGSGASGTALAISADGRFVAFDSWASDLVVDDDNEQVDIFVRDLQTGAIERVSVDSSGAEANGPSFGVSMSADGRFVAFSSRADNLIAADGNGVEDVFLHDRSTGVTQRISETPQGIGGNGVSYDPVLSATGRHVAYVTRAVNLVSQPLGPYHYVFVHDTQSAVTWHASVNTAGDFAHGNCSRPSITADGRFVAFASAAYNLVDSDTNGVSDVFVHDRLTASTIRVSLSSSGAEANGGCVVPSLSDDGSFVSFMSSASNLVVGDTNGLDDVFLRDLTGTTVERISSATFGRAANGSSSMPAIASGGGFVVFTSDASNLVPGDTNQLCDVFLCATR